MNGLQVRNLHKKFVTPSGREVVALDGVSFDIPPGAVLAVVGHNGSGKTTLLNCIRHDVQWDEGEISFAGTPLARARRRIVSVFQDVELGVVSSMTPAENLSLAFSHNRGFRWTLPERCYRADIDEMLQTHQLGARFSRYRSTPASDLSGGERQQLAILMAIMRKPDILLLDEFVANLDPLIKSELLTWMRAWIKDNSVTTVMVTHDMAVARAWGEWLLELSQGVVTRFEACAPDAAVPDNA